MNIRLRTFEEEARNAFDFLVAQNFSAGSFASSLGNPKSLSLTYRRADAVLTTSLTLGYMGEEYVDTVLDAASGQRHNGPSTAHTGYQMRTALGQHARDVAGVINSLD